MNKLILLAVIFSCSSAFAQSISKDTIIVNPYKSVQNYEHFRRFVLNTNNPEVEYISNFNFEWGYSYQIIIEVKKLSSTLSDGTRYEHKFIKELSKSKTSDTVEYPIFLHADRYYYEAEVNNFKPINDSIFMYMEEVEIEVPDLLKSKFMAIVNGNDGKRAYFKCVNEKRIRLVKIQ